MSKSEVYTEQRGNFEFKLYCTTSTNYSDNTYTVTLRGTMQKIKEIGEGFNSESGATQIACYIPNGQYDDSGSNKQTMFLVRCSGEDARCIIYNDGSITDIGTYTRTFNMDTDGTIKNVYIYLGRMGSLYNANYLSDKASNGHKNINGTWKNGYFWRKINGTWKRCLIWKKINGIWKKGI